MSIVRFIVAHCGQGAWSQTTTPHLLLTPEGRQQNRAALLLLRWALAQQPAPEAAFDSGLEHARQTRLALESGLGLQILEARLFGSMARLGFPPGQGVDRLLQATTASTTGAELLRASKWVVSEAQRVRNELVLKASQVSACLGLPSFLIVLLVAHDCLPGLLVPNELLLRPGDVMSIDVDTATGLVVHANSRIYRVE